MNFAIFVGLALTSALLLWPRLSEARLWRAATTPLASIIGSGFLVLGPILHASFGQYAPVAMALLAGLAYAFGAAIRFNIQCLETGPARAPRINHLETLASWVLSFAYVISVAYYLNLFGAFAVSLTTFDTPLNARLVTSTALLIILIVGTTKGFTLLERLEQISVGVKLSIIGALLVGLILYFAEKTAAHELRLLPANISGWGAIPLMFGLLITVQGFETSRYLGETYDAQTRVSSMRLAQILSTLIYLIYIALLTYAFAPTSGPISETAIIDMMGRVAPVLPWLLVTAALAAQFSAAIADTSGSGGLMAELSDHKISEKTAYVLLVAFGFLFTWTIDIFAIISTASRAFALYYALQSAIAALNSHTRKHRIFFTFLFILGLLIVVFATAIEGA